MKFSLGQWLFWKLQSPSGHFYCSIKGYSSSHQLHVYDINKLKLSQLCIPRAVFRKHLITYFQTGCINPRTASLILRSITLMLIVIWLVFFSQPKSSAWTVIWKMDMFMLFNYNNKDTSTCCIPMCIRMSCMDVYTIWYNIVILIQIKYKPMFMHSPQSKGCYIQFWKKKQKKKQKKKLEI